MAESDTVCQLSVLVISMSRPVFTMRYVPDTSPMSPLTMHDTISCSSGQLT